jgi:hypothetical protein
LLKGEIGAGPRVSVSAYWFNAYSGFFGCANLTPFSCTIRISGYQYDASLRQEVLRVRQTVTVPPCIAFVNCRLTEVIFDPGFRTLSGIQFEATVLGIGSIFFLDSLEMAWVNNTCSAGILRMGNR